MRGHGNPVCRAAAMLAGPPFGSRGGGRRDGAGPASRLAGRAVCLARGNNMCAMARSLLARRARARTRRVGPALRGLRAAIAAAAGAVVVTGGTGITAAVLGVPAIARAAAATQPASEVALTVRSMSPPWARTGRAITISGTVRNLTAAPLSGIALRLFSSRFALASSALVTYARTGSPQPLAPVRAAAHVPARISAHATVPFTAQVPAASIAALRLTCFGVYPLTVELTGAGAVLASHPVPLPFWPANPHGCRFAPRPQPALINWVWPLIDVPRQGPCPGILHDNGLADSLAADGRLSELLAVGARYAASAHLTWAVDPALLDNASLMGGPRPYLVGGRANCVGARHYPASRAAAAWLVRLRHAIAGQTVFATPYADVNEAVLIRRASMDIGLAIADGEQVAGKLLGVDPVPAPPTSPAAAGSAPAGHHHRHQVRRTAPAGPHRLASIAWPLGGKASSALLEYLGSLPTGPAHSRRGTVSQVSTVILAMPRLAPGSLTPGAVASELTGTGANLHVLLTDNGLDRLLGSPAASSRKPGAIFTVRQLFLAETAMIIAANPRAPHSIVVAPPRRWDPAQPLAASLLAGTVAAPWLAPASAGQLISTEHARSYSVPQARPDGRNADRLLAKINALNRRIDLLQTILVDHNPALKRAVYGIESSAWRGGGTRHARALLGRMSQYISAQFAGLSVSGSDVTLGGTVSNGVKVAVRNRLGYRVQVRLMISHSNNSVTAAQKSPGTFVVDPTTTRFVLLSVHAQQGGSATLTIRLISPGGARLPVAPATMRVQATDFGTVALVIGAVALGIFVLASALRAIRHGRGGAAPSEEATAPGAPEPPAGGAEEAVPRDITASGGRLPAPPSAEPVTGALDPGSAGQDDVPQSPASAGRILPRAPEEPDSVVLDRSDLGAVSQAELAPAGQAAAAQARGAHPPGASAERRADPPGGDDAPEENR